MGGKRCKLPFLSMAMAWPDPKTWSDLRKEHFEYFEQNLPPGSKSKRLVDLGSGVTPFRELFFKFDYVGVDFKKQENVTIVADITKPLPLPDNFCDIVTLLNVLEHIPNPHDLLREAFRLLKPGGIIIGAVPFFVRLHKKPYDFHRYTSYALDYLLKNAGFSRIEVENIGQPFYIYKETQDYFFNIFLRNRPKGLKKIFWILFIKLTLLQTRLFKNVFNQTSKDDSFPAGYGFKAIKGK